ncbi:alpha,alpha-phosphotrehalase [Priestia megaterium]|uniref:alpha,alpha-phosphotrehalase n=1 Tax=Priestia megaterium TaxID=1404 RepID=UPI000BF80815|nr:alpha,alpha-phosphotrehalase [Priestia megaterium]PFW51741.1 alpha,alpha-phosphotrehalase [Priestia megaterium]TJZ31409.1 alpha,alpha-phosphotrehalase [Priestia megaterium]
MKSFKTSTIYQIYPKSYYDSNQDGLGDLKGITEKLDYLHFLGVDYLWITPFFVSPQNDNGYDVEKYCEIDPLFGTMEDFEELVKESERRGMGVMLDMVFNHTSTQHTWFQKALSGDEHYKDYYIFQDGVEGTPPTNWISKFGGSAWEYVPSLQQYYLHLFDKTQADLNWENPKVRDELVNILKFWINKGIKGFRFDVVNLISKPYQYKDDIQGDGRRFYTDGPKVHQYLKEICKRSGLNDSGMVTVGEMSSTTIDHCVRYSNPEEEELSMCFNFHHLKVDYKNQEKWELQDCDFIKLKDLLNTWQVGMQEGNGWNALFWCNHDQPRILSRFGDDKGYYKESAKMLATMIHLLRGTPYIYQGEEIGMTNAYFKNISQYKDVESINYYHILKEQGKNAHDIMQILQERSRDNSRTPMQWSAENNAGFSKERPWIDVIGNYKGINVEESITDKNSIFHYYKKLISLRKEHKVISEGNYSPLLPEHQSVFAYKREFSNQSLLVINNFYGQETETHFVEDLTGYQCILSNYPERQLINKMMLRPYESMVYLKVK